MGTALACAMMDALCEFGVRRVEAADHHCAPDGPLELSPLTWALDNTRDDEQTTAGSDIVRPHRRQVGRFQAGLVRVVVGGRPCGPEQVEVCERRVQPEVGTAIEDSPSDGGLADPRRA